MKIGGAILIVVTLYVCYFSHLGSLGFVGPDEPRYAWIARAMAETGDWVTPRLYGVPWFEKPVLYYWSAALSFRIFGVSEAAARLPSAVSALLATLALGWLAWRVYGTATARWLLLLLPTTVGMIGFSHAASTDMPFSAMLTVAMVCAAVVLGLTRDEKTPILPRTPWLALLLFGLFLGLAVLAKGPAAIVLSGGAVFFWAIFTRRWRDAFRLLHPVAILAFCATALPWYIFCARRNPDFFRVFIIEHNFKRFLTPEFQHIQPFWYYVPVLLVAFLPWTGTLLWSVVVASRSLIRRTDVDVEGHVETGRNEAAVEALGADGGAEKAAALNDSRPALQGRFEIADGLAWFLVCWAGFCVIFFSASHSKLPGYVLPAIPAIGLLMARAFVEVRDRHGVSFRIVHFVVAASFFMIFAVMEMLAGHPHWGSRKVTAAVAILSLVFALVNAIAGALAPLTRFRRHDLAAGIAAVPVLGALLFANSLLASFFFWDPSGRTVAHEVRRRGIPAGTLSVSGMKRGMQYGLSFYLRQEIKEWDAKSETGGYLLTASHNCERVVGAEFFCEAQPFDTDGTGIFLYLVIPIAGGK